MSHNRTRCWGRPNRSPLIGPKAARSMPNKS
uniref:Uncharacterized protein n=1 Tax=Arundo donax TaxID=35708 RepID=A0A0A8XPC0_ARUDO